MIVSLSEMKGYLRVDHDDDDALISSIILASEDLCAHVARVTHDELVLMADDYIRTAVMFASAYLYEHREEADHGRLDLDLRALLFGVRKEGF